MPGPSGGDKYISLPGHILRCQRLRAAENGERETLVWGIQNCGGYGPRIKVWGYMGKKSPKIDHIPPQFSQPVPISPRSFPIRGTQVPRGNMGVRVRTGVDNPQRKIHHPLALGYKGRTAHILHTAWSRFFPNSDLRIYP